MHYYYDVLGVSRHADQKLIKEAFRRLALRYQSHGNADRLVEERINEIAAAYVVLSDEKTRAEYDTGRGGLSDISPEDPFAGIDFSDLLEEFGS